ncbi:hypothetical protein ACIQOU_29170 [Streptomyces sp. NPDC091279]|uniref:hypothetical protein n=1 Tax=unclassified Streptomyces TaxID=2593676 RepID=UPI003803B367
MAEPAAGGPAPEDPRSPWLRTSFVMAAAFVGFIAVIAAAVVFTSSGNGEAAEPATPTDPATPTTGTGTGTGKGTGTGTCPTLPTAQQAVPTAAPTGITWTLFDAVALPASKTAGPAITTGDVARCYAHTPVGALLASSQISVRYLAAGDWQTVTRTQTLGAGRDTYLADRAAAEQTAEPGDSPTHGQIAGFRFVTYHDTTAVVETVWRFPDGTLQAATTTVLWRDGDWRLEFPADPAAPTPVDSVAGYVSWGGV